MYKIDDGKLVEMTEDEIAANVTAQAQNLEIRRTEAGMSRTKFAILSARAGWITEEEALLWVGGTSIPNFVSDIIVAQIPEDKQLIMKIKVLTQDVIGRKNMLIPMLMADKGVSDEQMDALFGIEG